MKLSEAIREGSKLRPRVGVLGERFSHVEGRGLCSDIWGAAVEAVQPAVANFNWNKSNTDAFQRSMDAFRAIQLQYFAPYFQMPLHCPGLRQNVMKVGGRLINRFGKEPELKTYDSYARIENFGGITSECPKVEHLAGMVDHLYHKHRVLAEKIANCVEEYENACEQGARQIAINRNFTHYAANWR
jgi:hypothetical protein